jgi:glycosyltransferase involved in cell wall biosynthesis
MNARQANRRLRLLVLTSTFPRWDGDATPRFVADLCVSLSKTMDVTVLAPASRGADQLELLNVVEVRRFRYGWPAGTQRLADGAILPNIRRNPLLLVQVPVFMLAELVAAWRLLSRREFDAIHAHWTIPQGIVATILKRRFGLPVLTTTHGSDLNALRLPLLTRMKRAVLRSSDAVTAVSDQLRDKAIGYGAPPERTVVLPMGVDTDVFSPERAAPALRKELAAGGRLILFVGRLAEVKGARFLIEAMPEILRDTPNARLAVIGDGPERKALEQRSRRLGLTEKVVFLGAIANAELPSYYASADVFVGPSVVTRGGDAESFGIVLAEAMASGCPVVASDLEGVADVTSSGEHALLVPPGDPAAIARAVTRVLDDSTLRERLRTRALQNVRERFSHAHLHHEYATLIDAIAA